MPQEQGTALTDELAQRWLTTFRTNMLEQRAEQIAEKSTEESSEKLTQAWLRLLQHYQQPHRHYHNMSHIHACLIWFDKVKAQLQNPLAVELAIWFHDVIYDVRKSDNELQSGYYAVTALTNLGVSASLIQQVYELILLTQHPNKPEPQSVDKQDQALLLDIDLSVLGQSQNVYRVYEAAIRAEYQHVPSWLYKFARKRLLKSFLKQPVIYHSRYFQEKFEHQARLNIQSALACRVSRGSQRRIG
ncbi:MAG: putative metal-dependent HD superfamily phosphohydrolase [Moritella sp.]|jgi:predicted metal-dependent HD superfamily phosphohydrolase